MTAAAHISPVLFLHQETSLRRISEGLQLHQALLIIIVNHLEQKDQVLALEADIRDLNIQITKVCVCVAGHCSLSVTPKRMHASNLWLLFADAENGWTGRGAAHTHIKPAR